MTTMWKPGTGKPLDMPKGNKQSSDAATASTTPKGNSSSAKKLSNATMGMRFMQRKADDAKKGNPKSVMQAVARQVNARNDGIHERNNRSDPMERKRDSTAITSSPTPPASDTIILEIASVVDMYGIGSDIIGRRSFGGFHKSVRATWDHALKVRTEEDARARNTKTHVTDEELLERYEKYVKGRSGNDSQGRKDKRKRNSS